MPFDETLLEPAGGFDEALLEPVEPDVPSYEITAPIAVEPYVPPASQEEQVGNVMAGVPVTAPGITPPLGFVPPQQFALESLLPMPNLPTPEQKPITVPERAFAMAGTFPGSGAVTAAFGPDVTAAMNRRAANVVPEMWNFLSSPAGIATGGLASIPSAIVKRLVSLGFSGSMLYSLYDQVKATAKDWDTLSPQQRGERLMDAAKTGGMAAMAGVHGAKGIVGMLRGRQAAAVPVPPPVMPEQPPPLPRQSAELLPQAARALMEQEAEKPREVKVEDYVPEEPTEVAVKSEELAPAVPVVQAKPVPPAETAKTVEPATAATAGAPKKSTEKEFIRVKSSLEEPDMPRPQELDAIGVKMDKSGKRYTESGTPLPEYVEPYAGGKGLISAEAGSGRRLYTIDSEDGKLHQVLLLKVAGTYDGKTKWTFIWTEGPSKGETTTGYAHSFWDIEQPAAPAAQPGIGGPSAIEKGQKPEGRQPEYPRTDAQREAAGPSRSDQPPGSGTEPQGQQGQKEGALLLTEKPTPPAAPAAAQAKMQEKLWKKTEFPQVAQPLKRLATEINVYDNSGVSHPIKGVDYLLPGFEEYHLAVSKPSGNKQYGTKQGWSLWEKTSGWKIAESTDFKGHPSSERDAIQLGLDRLRSMGKQRIDQRIWDIRDAVLKAALERAENLGLTQEGGRKGSVPPKSASEQPSKGPATPTLELSPSPAPPAGQVGQPGPGLSEGPGATALGAPAAGGKSQIEQLGDAFAAKAPSRDRAAQLVRESFDFGHRAGAAKDMLGRALGALKSSSDAVWTALTKFDKPDQLLQAKGSLSAELETRGWRVRQFAKNVRKAIPDKRRRAAIAKWVDAGGDDARLALGEAATKPEFKQAYRDARNLSADDKIAAQNVQNYFDSRLQEAIDADVLEAGLQDYIHRIYQNDPATRQRALAYVQSGILTKNPSLSKKRFYEFDYEAEAMGRRPVQDFLPRLTDYETSLSKAIAARKFIGQLTQMTAADGRPIIGIKGLGLPVEDQAGVRTGTVIKPLGDFRKNSIPGTPDYRGDYKTKEYPSLSRWKWIGQDTDGKPIFMQGPVAIHPAYIDRVEALLEPSHVRYGSNEKLSKIGRGALGASSVFKQTMLDLSGFHQVQIALHAMEHRVMPWRIVKDIDFADPKVEGLLKGGVTLGGDYHDANFGEGLFGKSLTQHVPILGPIAESYHSWLFQSFIPRVKMTMALHALERNRVRYSKDLATGRMTEQDLNYMTAKQANAAFGELNYTMLERNKTIQDLARLSLLAPDFLEARGRFVAQALTKYGAEQRVALLLGAVTMYTLARIMNKISDDQYHFEPENAFSLVKGNHSYSLRTVQGDVLHLIDQPIRFWLNRLNPLYTRTILEAVTQRDVFGRKRSATEIALDTIKNIQPISTRYGRERSLWESMANSFGLVAKRWNDVDKAFKLAGEWKKANKIQERGEFIYDPDKDPLRALKLALNDGDEATAALEIQKLFRNRVMPKSKLDDYFQRFAKMPFTGSQANDNRFLASLTEDQRKTVANARKHRYKIGMAYRNAMSKYVELVNKPPQ